MPDLNKIHLFRITHIENVPHILQFGITHITSAYANQNYVPIGDVSLINSRNSFILPNRKLLGQYIPFYFWARMPMLYVIQGGFNGVPVTEPVYCVTNVRQILDHRIPFVFTNGHAVDCLTEFYGEQEIEKINELLDFNAIKSKYWIDENDLDRKRRKEAEFLVEKDIPIAAITGWIVYNEDSKNRLINLGIDASKVLIKRDFYF